MLCSVCCDILKGAIMALDLISVTAQKKLADCRMNEKFKQP